MSATLHRRSFSHSQKPNATTQPMNAQSIAVIGLRTVEKRSARSTAFRMEQPTAAASFALYQECKSLPGGGITRAAKAVGMSPDVLQKKLSPMCDTHKLTLDEAEAITKAMHLVGGAIALARSAGLACVPIPRSEEGSLARGMSDVARDFSELLNEFAAATRDGLISENECARFECEATKLFIDVSVEIGRLRSAAESRERVAPA